MRIAIFYTAMIDIREKLERKLDKLSTEQLNSVCQFIEFLEYKQEPVATKTPITNEEIDRIFESYHQQNRHRPISLAKIKLAIRDESNAPLADQV